MGLLSPISLLASLSLCNSLISLHLAQRPKVCIPCTNLHLVLLHFFSFFHSLHIYILYNFYILSYSPLNRFFSHLFFLFLIYFYLYHLEIYFYFLALTSCLLKNSWACLILSYNIFYRRVCLW